MKQEDKIKSLELYLNHLNDLMADMRWEGTKSLSVFIAFFLLLNTLTIEMTGNHSYIGTVFIVIIMIAFGFVSHKDWKRYFKFIKLRNETYQELQNLLREK